MKKIVSIVILGAVLLSTMHVVSADGTNIFGGNENLIGLGVSDTINYVIITTDDLKDAVLPLKTWKEYLGYNLEIVTISWITDTYPGIDVQEQMRNFLIDKYSDWGINYVLIVGSRTSIPMRTCHPIPSVYPDSLETDYYYADVTGDWDADQDGYYGEYEDDDVDFLAELSLGRLPSDDPETLTSICKNIIRFESDSGDWKKSALLLGAIIYYENLVSFEWVYERSDGAMVMEECRSDIFEPYGFSCTRMYEADGIRPSTYTFDYALERSTVLSEWQKGYGVVNMLGHSNEKLASRLIWDHDDGDNVPEMSEGELVYRDMLRSTDARQLSLKKPPIVFSAGCSQLHTSSNMGRRFMESSAAVAYIGTTDLGFYNATRVWRDESDGGAFSLDYYFFDYLINDNQSCGDALCHSKEVFLKRFMFTTYDPDWIYRCYSTLYGFTLYGDPSLGLFSEKKDENPPEITLVRPKNCVYLFDKEISFLPLPTPFIVGGITLNVVAMDAEAEVDRIEIWVDDDLKHDVHDTQVTWFWDDIVLGRHRLQIVAYDIVGNSQSYEQEIVIFNFNMI